jgi:hypothetical protein
MTLDLKSDFEKLFDLLSEREKRRNGNHLNKYALRIKRVLKEIETNIYGGNTNGCPEQHTYIGDADRGIDLGTADRSGDSIRPSYALDEAGS